MKIKFEKLSAITLFHLFSLLNIFIKNQKITKKKLIYGAILVGLTTSIVSCNKHRHTCYTVAPTNNIEINDSINTNVIKK